MIIAIKTDSMMAELRIVDQNGDVIMNDTWDAGRELSRDLLRHIDTIVGDDWERLEGIVIFRGPGSFTSLRIGITTANTIAYAKGIPIVGELGTTWFDRGFKRIIAGENDQQVMPEYGADPHITSQKK